MFWFIFFEGEGGGYRFHLKVLTEVCLNKWRSSWKKIFWHILNSYEILTLMKSHVHLYGYSVYKFMKKKKYMKLVYSRFEISDAQGMIIVYIQCIYIQCMSLMVFEWKDGLCVPCHRKPYLIIRAVWNSYTEYF